CMLRRPLPTVLSLFSIRSATTTRWYCSPSSSSAGDEIPTVRTTGTQYVLKGNMPCTKIGIYWGEGDPRNTLKNMDYDGTDFKGAKLRSIIYALEQAKKDGLRKIRVQTDFEVRGNFQKVLQGYKDRNFTSYDGKIMTNAKKMDKLLSLMEEMEVTLEYRTAWLDNHGGNEVQIALMEDSKRKYAHIEKDQYWSPDYVCDWTITPNSTTPVNGRKVPTVYVAGLLEMGRGTFKFGAFAYWWVPESIEHLEPRQKPLGATRRLSIIPVTRFRAQLVGIQEAIREAVTLGLPEIQVITDSLPFMHFYKIGWKKLDGTPVANEKIYNKIKALTESTTKVHFKGDKLEKGYTHEPEMNEIWTSLYEKAHDGLRYPMECRDTKEYGMSIDELLLGKDDVHSVEGTSTRRVRYFKETRGKASCPPGALWDRMDGVPLEGEEAESAVAFMEMDRRKTPTAMLHAVMEHADRMGFERIVIRTNSSLLVRSTLAFLEVYNRYDYLDQRWKKVKDAELWKRIYELKEKIEIIWDVIDKVDKVKDEAYFSKYRKRKKKERGRPKKKAKGLPPGTQ
ncbi:hypothetical protein PFISCL1PPCAC_5411, partial [Pristionchus fissidentatus]